MIAVRLMGGLGNQMFQYAAGRALAERIGTEFVLDNRSFTHYKLRDYGLNKFAIKAQVGTAEQIARWPLWFRRLSKPLRRLGIRSRWYLETQFHYDSTWNCISDGTIIDGHFQSERYFPGLAEALRQEFIPVAPLSLKNEQYAELACGCESVMLHVRRGDYVSDPHAAKTNGVCTVEYYKNAISTMRAHLEKPRFFVF